MQFIQNILGLSPMLKKITNWSVPHSLEMELQVFIQKGDNEDGKYTCYRI